MKREKSANYILVSNAVTSILEVKGMRGLTISAVARESKVSRPWIYKYIGKKQTDLLAVAISQLTEILGNLNNRQPPRNREEWIQHLVQGTATLLENSLKFPSALSIYYRYTADKTELGKAIQKAERRYISVLVKETSDALGWSEATSRTFAEHFTLYRIGLAYRYCQNKDFRKQGLGSALAVTRKILAST